MKVIKKYFKVIICFMAFALCSFLMVFAPTMTAMAATANITSYTKTINSVKMKKSINATTEDLVIPFLTKNFSENGSYSIKVVDPAGYTHTAKVNVANVLTDNGNGYFEVVESKGIKVTALTAGNYQVVYVVEVDGKEYYSNIYNVQVKNVSYELDFSNDNGSVNLIKSEVKTSSNSADRIEVPVPSAKVVGDDTAASVNLNPETEISVSYNGSTLALSTTGAETDYVKDETTGKYYIQPSKAGIYKIQYTFKRGVNRPTKTITIKVSDNFVAPTEFKVSTVPTFNSFELGEKDITLPKLTAKNEFDDDVDYNVKTIKIEKENDSSISKVLENNNYTFDMTLSAFGLNEETDNYEKLKGNYVITYTLVDAYNNECTYTKRIENVTISSKPTIKMVYDYAADGTMLDGDFTTTSTLETVVNADTELHNKYGYDEIVLPAVYAEDAVSKSSDLIVVRYLRNVNSSTLYYVDNLKYDEDTKSLVEVHSTETGYNYANDSSIGQINKAVKFAFSDDVDKAKTYDGTYQLEYRVIAKNITKRENTLTITGSTKYTFTVLGYALSEYTKTEPTVELTMNDKYVDRAEKLNVTLTAKDDDDSRLKNVVYYYYGNGKTAAELKTAITNNLSSYNTNTTKHFLDNEEFINHIASSEGFTGLTQAKLSEDGKNYVVEFDTEGANASATKATIVAISFNDYNNIAVDAKVVDFKLTDEEVAPEVTIIETGDFNSTCSALENSAKAKIGETITLPTIKYEDVDKTLLTNVSYYVNSPMSEDAGLSYLSPSKKQYSGLQIVGGQIKIDRAGNYVVVYTATDDAGNTSVTYFTFSVASETKPLLTVNPSESKVGNTITAEVGSTINFDTIVRDGDSKNVVDGTVTVEIEDNGLDYSLSGDKEFSYIFNSVGKYTLKFKANYNGKDSVEQIIVVDITAKAIEWEGEFNLPEYADVNSEVYLPDVSASQNAVVKVTVTPPNGSKLEEDVKKVSRDAEDNIGSYWKFKTNSTKGNYTIKYTATTADSSLEKTFTIKVGDNVPPTIEFEHKAELEQNIVYDGTNQIQIKFDVKKTGAVSDRYFKITASSNGENIYSYDLGLKITDITDGSVTPTTMYWTNLKYEITGDSSVLTKDSDNLYLISGTGTFTIKLSITDDNGNETVENIVFKVVSESEVDEKKDTVVGVVLIVISAVVLVGVILYFVFAGRKGGNNKSKTLVKASKKQVAKTGKEETKQAVVEEVENAESAEVEKTENTEAKEGEIEE